MRARLREDAESNLRSGFEPMAERLGATSAADLAARGAGAFFAVPGLAGFLTLFLRPDFAVFLLPQELALVARSSGVEY